MGFETFNSAMKKSSRLKRFNHLEGLKTKAVFSDCGKYRYLLEISKDTKQQGKRVCAVMLNPSVANESQADLWVLFLEILVFQKGSPYLQKVTGLSVVNLFAFIQTREFAGSPEHIGPLNDRYLDQAIAAADIVLIAWGKSCAHPERQAVVMNLLDKHQEKAIFVTKSHPSRGTYQDFIRPYSKKKGPC